MNKIPGRIRRDILVNNFRYFNPELLATIGKNGMIAGTWDWESSSPHDVGKQKQGQWRACRTQTST